MADNFELFTTIDDTEIEKIVTENLEETLSETLHPGDERLMFANAFITLLCTVFAYLNDRAKMRLLRFAEAETLDYIGERVNCPRLGKEKATAIERYKLAAPLSINVPIPMGSTVTPDGVLVYETTVAASIPAGETYVDIPIQAQEGGSVYNDYVLGSINTQVSNVPYIASVENVSVPTGGDDGEPYPLSDAHPDGDDGTGDNNYRERIRKAPAGFSTAGPEEAYEYFALSADASVEDVKVVSEQAAGRIDITVTTTGGQVPTEDILQKVLAKCSDKTVRPMNDDVHVYAPEVVEYDIEVEYFTTEDTESDAIAAIEGEGGAIDQYISWQSAKITRDINPDKLKSLIVAAGAKRANIISPVFTDLDVTESVTSYEVKDTDNNIRYVAAEGEEDAAVPVNTDVYINPRLTGESSKATENQYTYTGNSILSPKGIGELAIFSGTLSVSHQVEGE